MLAACLCAGLLGWSGTTVAGVHREESLSVVCSSVEDLCRGWAEEFTRRTGIPVSTVRLSSREALARLDRGEAVDVDVWHGGPAELYVLAAQRGLLAPHDVRDAAAIPAADRASDGAWTGVYHGNLGFCSDPEALASLGLAPPQSWEDLLDPRLHGRVSMPNPGTSGTGTTVVGVQVRRMVDADAAVRWLRRLDRAVLQYTRSGMAPAGVVARGEAAVAVTFTQHCVRQVNAGRRLVVTYPREGTGAEVGAVARIRTARHPEWAAAYVDFAASRAGQDVGRTENVPQLPTRSDIPVDPRLLLPDGVPLLVTSTTDAAATESVVARFAEQVRP
ncbi:extracellular solute-binding protein [Mobilicoccus pelagius]|uniref:Putative ABC transporter substrate-binding protein n=1 Tax=Mobilicoccus pelagius NBRC 104925 TaxID=1089455 RepID=H5UNP3_9MICO|nr:extracellular solute-binding protein [Mobilicoccus pelagius]GAB47351.1 putative ABC transporter substrate-binding protein [Mobilicoccus pelagius NBRC 104925]